MSDKDILRLLVNRNGAEWITRELNRIDTSAGDRSHTLTIISNVGIHPLPSEILQGEVFLASEGNLDFSSMNVIASQYADILTRLSQKLKSQEWTNIYILPFGHCTLSMQIKLLVYRVTRIEAKEIFHLGGGKYDILAIDQRPIINNA
ncbi:hypothetical protein [Myxococcus vastator]|uniref:hypothetical protein n=1 Tax=Myxococcus vastator TaxID=2709664 RepID=UPI0013D7464E|nr:hypothetical protein [Myxococcus vastator]